jgi:uncharacterized membrane protein YfcA
MRPVPDSPLALAAVLLAGFAGGAVNAVAGGGTNLSFPALLWLGLPPVAANATSAVALWPGSWASAWGFRKVLRQARPQWLWLLVPSLLGGVLGAVLLVRLPPESFRALAPWLVLGSTLLFVAEPWLRRRFRVAAGSRHAPFLAYLAQLAISIYGGYFGAGMGILMLASLGISGVDDLAKANGLKNLLAAAIKAAAVVSLAFAGAAVWSTAAVMAVGAVFGGWAGAALSLRLPPRVQRLAVIALGVLMTVATFAGLS